MNKENKKTEHHRKNIRLKNYNYSQQGYYFVTICIKDHKCLLGKIIDNKMILNQFGIIVEKFWLEIPNRFENVKLLEYVIMPNHIHGIIHITKNFPVGAIHESPLQQIHELPLQLIHESSPQQIHELTIQQQKIKQRRNMILPKIIGRFKMQSAKHINLLRKTPGVPVWQRNYFEHIIRNEKSYFKIAEYILNNPLNWKKDKYYA